MLLEDHFKESSSSSMEDPEHMEQVLKQHALDGNLLSSHHYFKQARLNIL